MQAYGDIEARGGLPEQSSERHAAILAAILDDLARHGYGGMQVDRIARTARISKKTLYDAFPSREEMVRAAVERAKELAYRRAAISPPPMGTAPQDVLAAYAANFRRLLAEREQLGLHRLAVEVAERHPSLAEAMHGVWLTPEDSAWQGVLAACGLARFQSHRVSRQRFGYLATDGLRSLVGMPALEDAKEREWTQSVARLSLDGSRGTAPLASLATQPAHSLPVAAPTDDLFDRHRAAGMRLSRMQFGDLLDAVAREFLDHGYHDAAISRAADLVGVSRMTLRRQFGSRDQLFQIAITHFARSYYCARPALPVGGQALAALEETAGQLYRRFHERDNIRLLRLATTLASANAGLARTLYTISQERELAEIDAMLASLQKKDGLRADLANAAAHFRHLAVHGITALLLPTSQLHGDDINSHAASSVAWFLDGAMA